MARNIQAIRGMNDCLPEEASMWQSVEAVLKNVLASYGYKEIRLPIIEQTRLFQRAIGKSSGVVEKEMYSFIDRNNNSLTLRPEGTAGCVRAGVASGLLHNREQRLWYLGSMFRYERPQKGRYRQFQQIGAEVFGLRGPDIDAELILLTIRWWKALGISDYVSLEINSVGSIQSRAHYCKALVKFLIDNKNQLDENCLRNINNSPMRILDTKDINVKKLLQQAPLISSYLDDESRAHFSGLCKILNLFNIPYKVNPYLVRGLDYYNRTVFEWTTTYLGSHKTICGGGRYDSLVEQLGGYSTPAIGCAIGIERLVLLIRSVVPQSISLPNIDVYIVVSGNSLRHKAIKLAEQLRDKLPFLRLIVDHNGGNFKKQFSRANKYGAKVALVLGEQEVLAKQIAIKDLTTGNQEFLKESELANKLIAILNYRKHFENLQTKLQA